jgi:hypothetical protein
MEFGDSLNPNSKETLLLNSLKKFYSNKYNLDILIPIIKQESNISLRILDWLVTNYSKKYNTFYEIYKNGNKTIFFLYTSYKNQLKAYSKKFFDPFCRRNRIEINLKELCNNYTGSVITTIGQLNFFRWFIENKLLNFVVLNISKIDNDMNETIKNHKIKKLNKNITVSVTNLSVVAFD